MVELFNVAKMAQYVGRSGVGRSVDEQVDSCFQNVGLEILTSRLARFVGFFKLIMPRPLVGLASDLLGRIQNTDILHSFGHQNLNIATSGRDICRTWHGVVEAEEPKICHQ